MKLFIVGSGRCGKDTVADFIQKKYGLTFESSSMFCAEHVVRPWLKREGITYDTLEACYADRANHRMDWYNAIRDYNSKDESRLSQGIFGAYDMYVGIRSRIEFLASEHLADLSIWIDASKRVEVHDPTIKILPTDCDVIIDNNGTEVDLEKRVARLFDLISRSYGSIRTK